MTALEAMACGTPVLASNTSSLPEVVGDAGLLVDPLDTRAIADGIGQLAEDAALRDDLRERGLRRAASWTWQRCARQTLEVLEEAVVNSHAMNVSRPPQRLLVVTLADMGDALLTIPALRALRSRFPAATIDVLTTPLGAAALRHRAPCDELIVLERGRPESRRTAFEPIDLRALAQLLRRLRAGRYDVCVLLRHLTTTAGALKHAAIVLASGAPWRVGLDNGRGWFLNRSVRDEGFGARHEASYWLEVAALLGAPPSAAPTTDAVPEPARAAALLMLAALGGDGPLVALSPGTGAFAPARRWPAQRFAEVARCLATIGARIVLVGGAEEAALRRTVLAAMPGSEQIIDLGGKTSIDVLAGVLQACDLFVGNDSGVAHLAAAVGTPVTAVFGPTDPRAYGPYGGEEWRVIDRTPGLELLASGPHRALWAPIACSPCIYRHHRPGTFLGCPDRTCLQRTDARRVVALIEQRLRELDVDSQFSILNSQFPLYPVLERGSEPDDNTC